MSATKRVVQQLKDTIFAVSSGKPPCAISVIRMTGGNCARTLDLLLPAGSASKLQHQRLQYTAIYHPVTRELLDRGMVVRFDAPHSYTGEDCCELHVHGGLAVTEAVLDALAQVDNNRMAEPGEFTKRAFFNNKMDVDRVEALRDLISAETTAQRRLALKRNEPGKDMEWYRQWREQLLTALSQLEAFINFSEDDNLNDSVKESVRCCVSGVSSQLDEHVNQARSAERVRHGVQVAILGRPNVGKSSLLNFLCSRPASIVSPIAGTTRDTIDVHLDVAGYPVVVSDTAGIRHNSGDDVEREGVRRAALKAIESDLIVFVSDVSQHQPSTLVESLCAEMSECLPDTLNDWAQLLLVINKIDTVNRSDAWPQHVEHNRFGKIPVHYVSCQEGQGTKALLHALSTSVKELCADCLSTDAVFTQSRQKQLLSQSLAYLRQFQSLSQESNPDMAVLAQKLDDALQCLARMTSAVSVDDVLDRLFQQFCIGK